MSCLSPDGNRGLFSMFTGIITDIGRIKKIEESKYYISADKKLIEQLAKGTSIAINGVCLTVTAVFEKGSFVVEVMPETLKKTMLADLSIKDLVNLELPMTLAKFFSGHIVQGHVDAVAKIADIKKKGNSKVLTVKLSAAFSKYIVSKGSIAVDGISLTVIEAAKNWFTVGIIPYTWANTNLQQSKVGHRVNVELDIIAKYVEKLIKTNG